MSVASASEDSQAGALQGFDQIGRLKAEEVRDERQRVGLDQSLFWPVLC